MFFDGWQSILRVLTIGPIVYIGLILILRLSGKRTLSKMNAFDLVVTVALGSTLSTALLTDTISLATGLTGLALLAALQYVVAWASGRWHSVETLVKSEPRLLFHRGEFLDTALRQERVTREEVLQGVRVSGHASLRDIEAVVLETDGSMTVMSGHTKGSSSLGNVKGMPEERAA